MKLSYFISLGFTLVCSLFLAGCGSPAHKSSPSPPIRPAINADAEMTEASKAYLNAMYEKIQARWENELKSRIYPGAGKRAIITFIMDSSGEIRRIKKVDGNAGKRGEEACVTAITAGGPYGKWPADMRATLGDEQELTITFNYQ